MTLIATLPLPLCIFVMFQDRHPFVHGHVRLDKEGSCVIQWHHHLLHWIWIHIGVSSCENGLSKVPSLMHVWIRHKCISASVNLGIEFLFPSRVGDRPVLLAGLAIIFCGFFILLPWGNHYPKIQWAGVHCFNCTDLFSFLCCVVNCYSLNASLGLCAFFNWNNAVFAHLGFDSFTFLTEFLIS